MKTLKEFIKEKESTFEKLFASNISYDFLEHFDTVTKELVSHVIKEKYGDLMIAEDYESMVELQQEVKLALRSASWGINRYWRVINAEYNPLDNYDRTETHTMVYAEDKTTNAYGVDKTSVAYGEDKTTLAYAEDKTTMSYGEDKTTLAYAEDKTTIAYAEDKTTTSTDEVKEHHKLAAVQNSDTLQTVPFDSSIAVPTNVNLHDEDERENMDWTDEYDITNTRNARSDTNTRDARSDTNTRDARSDTNTRDARSDTNTRDAHTDTNTRDARTDTNTRSARTDTETINAHGNIGTTRSQEMVSDEMSLALRNYNEFLARTIIEDITIPIFE